MPLNFKLFSTSVSRCCPRQSMSRAIHPSSYQRSFSVMAFQPPLSLSSITELFHQWVADLQSNLGDLLPDMSIWFGVPKNKVSLSRRRIRFAGRIRSLGLPYVKYNRCKVCQTPIRDQHICYECYKKRKEMSDNGLITAIFPNFGEKKPRSVMKFLTEAEEQMLKEREEKKQLQK
eukprot:163941_1